jgi:predicted nucleotidyltransferase
MATSRDTTRHATGETFDIDAARTSYRQRQRARRDALLERWTAARADADRIVAGIRDRWQPERIVIWGSLLRPEQFVEYSDIDIAVGGIREMERWSEMESWALDQTGFSLDLVPLEKVHPEHLARILERGSLVYEREVRHG